MVAKFVRAVTISKAGAVAVLLAGLIALVSGPVAGSAASTAPACVASQLNAVGARQGESMGAAGLLIFVNVSSRACRLAGEPELTLYGEGPPGLSGNILNSTKPSNPVTPLLLKPRHLADLTTYWANWCGSTVGPLRVIVTLPGDAQRSLGVPFDGPPEFDEVPQCVN